MLMPRLVKLVFVIVIAALVLMILVKYPQYQVNAIEEISVHPYDQEIKEQLHVSFGARRLENDTLPDLGNFPWAFYKRGNEKPSGINEDCGKFPSIADIRFNNLYWQKSVIDGVELYLMGAYYDVRPKEVAVVRILLMADSLNLDVITKCQLWYEDGGVATSFTWSSYVWLEPWGYQSNSLYQPYLVSCAIPGEFANQIPQSVSLVGENVCETATNNLYVNYNVGKRSEFGVCVKGLSFQDDISIKLTEWIELINILGASKIYFYNFNIHENTEKLLKHYSDEKQLVEVIPTSLPGKYPNVQHLQHAYLRKYSGVKRLVEVMQYNDCFYRNMYKHDYLVMLDVDEVIIPRSGDWSSLISSFEEKASFYYTRNVYFFENRKENLIENIPSYMSMLQNVYRTKEFSGDGLYVKSFYSTRDVLTVHNHVPLQCMSKQGKCISYGIETDKAQLHHYRKTCVEDIGKEDCSRMKENLELDTNVWQFKDELIKRVNETIKELDLL